MSNDIALLKLGTPAKLNKRVGLACLPDKSVDLPINDINTKCWITGMKCFFNPVQRDVSGYLIKTPRFASFLPRDLPSPICLVLKGLGKKVFMH